MTANASRPRNEPETLPWRVTAATASENLDNCETGPWREVNFRLCSGQTTPAVPLASRLVHKRSNQKLHAMICAAALAAFFVVGAFCWSTMRYKLDDFSGDGRIYDAGCRSFPRYRVTMDPIRLVGSQERIYRINNLPRITADIVLKVGFPRGAQRANSFAQEQQAIHKFPIYISCELVNEQGERVCFADGQLSTWTVAVSERQLELWQTGCRAVEIERNQGYVLHVRVSVAKESPQGLSITPVLQGGGRERL